MNHVQTYALIVAGLLIQSRPLPDAEAFRKDIPNARVEFLDTGHFAVETHGVEIAAAMKEFLATSGASR